MGEKYTVSFFNNCYSKFATVKHLSFDEFVAYLNVVVTKKFETKDKLEAVICGTLRGGERNTDNLVDRSIITYDIDYYNHNLDVVIKYIDSLLEKIKHVYYTTVSSDFENPKLRVLLFLDKPLLKDQYSETSKHIAKIIFKDLFNEGNYKKINASVDSAIDNASYSPMQLMYLPIKTNCHFRAGKNPNNPLRVEEYLPLNDVKLDETDSFVKVVKNTPKKISENKIKATLSKYDCSDTDYHSWVQVCQALHHQYKGDPTGLDIFIEWSMSDSRYSDKKSIVSECTAKYESMKSSNKNPITFASIIQIVNGKQPLVSENNLDIAYEIDKNKFVHLKYNVKGDISGIKTTYENFKILCKNYKINISYDIITKRNVNSFNNKDDNLLSGKITSLMELNGLKPNFADKYINMLAHENSINSFKDILDGITWDGKSRLSDFYKTVVVDIEYEEIKKIYLLKWLQQMLYLSTYEGHRKIARNLLVFQSEQSSGKSTWLKSLLPSNMTSFIGEGLQLNTNDHMSILTCIRHVFVELAELEQSFKKTDINSFKAFYGRTIDTLNIKYLSYPVSYVRTTSFLGTVNDKRFLKDRTGSTRFLVLPVKTLNGYHNIDMLMLYKEILETTDYVNFELSEEDKDKQKIINEQFDQPNLIEEQFVDMFDIESKDKGEYKSCTQILEQIGYSKRDINRNRRLDLEEILDKYEFKYRKDLKKWRVRIKSCK